MSDSQRHRLFIFTAVLLGAVPVAFGAVRAVSTGYDVRYLWLAAAAIAGSMMVVMPLLRGVSGRERVSPLRALSAVAAGTLCAAASALAMGTTAGPGLAVVAIAFGLCTGASAAVATLARSVR